MGNEPCFLTKTGLYSVRSVSNELTNLNETVRRSMTVDPLFQKLPLEKVRSICWNGYYLLVFGKTALITDGRMVSGSFRFLKWIFAHEITAVGQLNGMLYLGSSTGEFFLLDGSADDSGIPITAYWQLPVLEEQKGRKMILRRLWAAVGGGGGFLSVRLRQDHLPWQQLSVHLEEENASEETRWVSLLNNPRLAETFSVYIDLTQAQGALLWGFRTTYEKGGSIK